MSRQPAAVVLLKQKAKHHHPDKKKKRRGEGRRGEERARGQNAHILKFTGGAVAIRYMQ